MIMSHGTCGTAAKCTKDQAVDISGFLRSSAAASIDFTTPQKIIDVIASMKKYDPTVRIDKASQGSLAKTIAAELHNLCTVRSIHGTTHLFPTSSYLQLRNAVRASPHNLEMKAKLEVVHPGDPLLATGNATGESLGVLKQELAELRQAATETISGLEMDLRQVTEQRNKAETMLKKVELQKDALETEVKCNGQTVEMKDAFITHLEAKVEELQEENQIQTGLMDTDFLAEALSNDDVGVQLGGLQTIVAGWCMSKYPEKVLLSMVPHVLASTWSENEEVQLKALDVLWCYAGSAAGQAHLLEEGCVERLSDDMLMKSEAVMLKVMGVLTHLAVHPDCLSKIQHSLRMKANYEMLMGVQCVSSRKRKITAEIAESLDAMKAKLQKLND
jgi:hypothetical protein